VVVKVDPRYFRPTEVDLLIGDASKAFNKLGWRPTYTLEELVKDMVTNDLELFRKEQFLRKSGFRGMNQYE
jgi:GDPmannose 4,6-dehydratase